MSGYAAFIIDGKSGAKVNTEKWGKREKREA